MLADRFNAAKSTLRSGEDMQIATRESLQQAHERQAQVVLETKENTMPLRPSESWCSRLMSLVFGPDSIPPMRSDPIPPVTRAVEEICFHGTSIENATHIIDSGFDTSKCRRTAFGLGIYASPKPTFARTYAYAQTTQTYAVLACRALVRTGEHVEDSIYRISDQDRILPLALFCYVRNK